MQEYISHETLCVSVLLLRRSSSYSTSYAAYAMECSRLINGHERSECWWLSVWLSVGRWCWQGSGSGSSSISSWFEYGAWAAEWICTFRGGFMLAGVRIIKWFLSAGWLLLIARRRYHPLGLRASVYLYMSRGVMCSATLSPVHINCMCRDNACN